MSYTLLISHKMITEVDCLPTLKFSVRILDYLQIYVPFFVLIHTLISDLQ